jgi:DNA invertase Pin-like site-specific DNA recombinase
MGLYSKEKSQMNLGYIRVSTDKQTVENQKTEILKYAQTKNIMINDFIEIEISSRKTYTQRKIDLLLETLNEQDNLFISELSRLGRSTKEVLDIIEKIMEKGIIIHLIKQNMILDKNNKNDVVSKVMITLFGLFAELERDFVSNRTKSALEHLKTKGVKLGKPKGVRQKTRFDKELEDFKNIQNSNNFSKLIKIINLEILKEKQIKDLTIDTTASADTDQSHIGLNLKYTWFDNKEKKEFIKTRLERQNILIEKARDYYLTKDLINNLKLEIKFLNLKDTRLKVRVANGIKNLDERIELIEKILETKKELSQQKINLESLRAFLINNLVSDIVKLL